MAQIFRPRANAFARILILGGVGLIIAAVVLAAMIVRSPYLNDVGRAPEQPVPFSHRHHVSGLGIDCRYCHTSVETSAFAGIPPTDTCMSCHSQLWTQAALLAPVRESLRSSRPLVWTRVNDVPDFVYFNHSIHIHKGVSCVHCHGRVDRMALTRREQAFHMGFCLNCHRAPARFLRPREKVFDLAWRPEKDQLALGRQLMQRYGIDPSHLDNCSICHR